MLNGNINKNGSYIKSIRMTKVQTHISERNLFAKFFTSIVSDVTNCSQRVTVRYAYEYRSRIGGKSFKYSETLRVVIVSD